MFRVRKLWAVFIKNINQPQRLFNRSPISTDTPMADDRNKTKAQLITKLEEMRQQRAIESASERIREEVLAMRSTQDLLKVVLALWRELIHLDILKRLAGSCSILFIDKEEERVRTYAALPNPKKRGVSWTSPELVEINEDVVVCHWQETADGMGEEFLEKWRQGEVWTVKQSKENYEAMSQQIVRQYGFDRIPWPIVESFVTNVPFTHGMVGFREKEYREDHIAIVKNLTEALSLGYLRFLDFQKVEAQNLALKEANEQIQEATRHKSEFLARMSHDLRTPMNAIIGYTRILLRRLKGAIDDRQYRNLGNIQTSADHLLNLINDILDLSKIEAGRIDIQPEPVDLKQLATECVVSVESLVKPEVTLEPHLGDVDPIQTDGNRLRRVVMNLLSNALKFTDEGSITLSLRPVDEGLELSVADTGMGIPAEDLPHIFDEFRQVERQGGIQKEGTGLGLAIAKKSVEMLGGTITAESKVGKGTTFTLRIKDYPSE